MAPDVWPDHDERKNAGTFSMRHDVDPENVLSLSARFRSRFFRRFILGRFPGHVFWTFLDHVFWTFYFSTFEDHDWCEKLTHSRTKREKNVTETSRPNSRKCNKHEKTRWITFSGRFIFARLRIATGAKG